MGREKQRFGCNKRELQPLKITWVKVTYPSQRHLRSLVSRCSRPNLLAVSLPSPTLACLRAHAKPPWRDAGYGSHYYCERFEPRSHFKSRLSLIFRVNVVLNRTVVVDSDWRFDNLCCSYLQSQDSEDGYRTGCRNASHCHQQQSYSGLRSPRRSNSTYFWSHYSLSIVMITRQFGNRKEIEKLRVRVLALRQSFVKGGGGVG